MGLDVGTTSTQMIVSRLRIENRASEFAVPDLVIADREILYESPVHFTPLRSEALVDGEALRTLLLEEYRHAGLTRETVDTGAVIVRNANEVLVLLCKALNELPGLILGAVVDEQHPAPVAHKAAGGKVVDLLQEQRGRDGQHCFLIITGDHDPENRFGHGKNSFLSFIAPSASERPGPAV